MIALLTKWSRIKVACEAVNDALWNDAYTTPETRAVAVEALDRMQDKAERVKRVLWFRYRVAVR